MLMNGLVQGINNSLKRLNSNITAESVATADEISDVDRNRNRRIYRGSFHLFDFGALNYRVF